jgi:hypothetical protein
VDAARDVVDVEAVVGAVTSKAVVVVQASLASTPAATYAAVAASGETVAEIAAAFEEIAVVVDSAEIAAAFEEIAAVAFAAAIEVVVEDIEEDVATNSLGKHWPTGVF